MMLSAAVQLLSEGIALAEGFYVAGSLAAVNHNPGNMTLDLIGKSVGTNKGFVVYANDQDGWENLYRQAEKILTDASSIYNSGMTLREIGQKYASTSPPADQLNWAINVASKVGIDIDTPVSTLLTAATTAVGLGAILVLIGLWILTKEKR